MSEQTAESTGTPGAVPVVAPVAGATMLAEPVLVRRRRGELLYYALHNKKLVLGLGLELVFVLAALFGPVISRHNMSDYFLSNQAPSAQHWLGTDNLGHDLFAEVVNGLQVSYLVGALGALCATVVGMALGFAAGWRGGILDEVLQMITNIVVMIPSLVLLIVIGAYLKTRGILFEGAFIGLTTWPWVARAVRAQTFTLKSREFVDLARMSGRRGLSIVARDIAPNMASYLFLVVILLFGSSMLLAANFDFLGLGPTTGTSLGNIMNQSTLWSALQLHYWWWFLPPGVLLTGMVAALLVANVGLDEVFNPKLREQ
ncbi:MAG: ABC transporter permease [Streptosporangiaceae bacterium]|nr:ABC transporter permease [Streptosporangiaceae bacterium]